MPKIAATLSESQVRKLTDPGRHAVSSGLYLRITDTGRFYEARVTVRGKRTFRRLGNAVSMPLAEARRQQALLDAEVSAPPRSRVFKDAAEDFIATHGPTWSDIHRTQWEQTMRDYAYPILGSMQCDQIGVTDIVEVLREGWSTKPKTFRRLRARIESVLIAEAARLGVLDAKNPADLRLLRYLLPKVEVVDQHYAAPSVEQLRSVLRGESKGVSLRMLKLIAYTGVRTSEARLADFSEFDFDAKTWTLPADRMKSGRGHSIPLTESAIKAVAQGKDPNDLPKAGLVFTVGRKEPSRQAILEFLKQRNLKFTTHGVRATLRSWCSENAVPHEVAESILAHTVGDKTVRAYARSNLLEQKREVLLRWEAVLNADR